MFSSSSSDYRSKLERARNELDALQQEQNALQARLQQTQGGIDTALKGIRGEIITAIRKGERFDWTDVDEKVSALFSQLDERNKALAHQLVANGLVISEFALGTPPLPGHFPRRNRLISGLSRGVLVVEAAPDSGSLITARVATEQGREVFAVPGSPLNPLAAGCLELLRQGATLARHAADILPEIAVKIEGNIQVDQQLGLPIAGGASVSRLDKDYEMLLDALGFEPSTVDDLVERTGLGAGSVASMLLILELEGRVETRPGALYNRIA